MLSGLRVGVSDSMTMSAVPTVSKLDYNATLRIANAVARAGEALGLRLGRLDAGSILDAARRHTGLEDWGDEAFLVPMRKLVEEVAKREDFTPLARVIMRQTWIRAVCNRLWIRDWTKRHPEVFERKVERPIFVLGFPRTGTTLIQNLLALDPARRGLPFWECTCPAPLVEDVLVDREQRRRTTRMMLQAAYRAAPEMAQVHFIDVETIEECWPLLANSFTVMNWELQSGLEPYGDFIQNEIDMRGPYGEYKATLQVLLDRNPAEQLVLKCPEHLWFVDALLSVFPDACIVWTHRDPYDTIASYSSLMSLQWRTLFGRIDRPKIGDFMERRMHVGIERAMDARTRHDPARFFDVRFCDLVADPAKVLEDISTHFSLDLSTGHRAKVKEYLSRKRGDEPGRHVYDGALYELDRDRVHERYKHYIDTFGIQTGKPCR